MKKIIFFIIAMCSVWFSLSNTITINHITYEIIDGHAEIIGYDSYDDPDTLVIPSSVVAGSRAYPVTVIRYQAFLDASGITHVEIPNTITYIGEYAFTSCTGLTSITLGNAIDSIGSGAFGNCDGLNAVYYKGNIDNWCGIGFYDFYSNPLCYANNLYINDVLITNLSISDNITQIKNYAFCGATCLTSVSIGSSVVSIGHGAFDGCSRLTGSLTIPNSVEYIGDDAFNSCVGFTGTLTIPNSVNYIGSRAFYGCRGFSGTLTIPNSIEIINSETFCGLNGIDSVNIPNSVIRISYGAFRFCTSLTSINIPNNVTRIGINAFYGCTSATTINIGNKVSYIGDEAFTNCSSLAGTLLLPVNLTYIGEMAFMNCSGLTGTLTIPDSVTYIGAWAFRYCSGLTSVTIGYSVDTIGDYAFGQCTGIAALNFNAKCCHCMGACGHNPSAGDLAQPSFSGCQSISSLNIGYNVTRVPDYAFGSGSSLGLGPIDTLNIPDSVTYIGKHAFVGLHRLYYVSLGSSVDTIGDDSFAYLTRIAEFHSHNVVPPYLDGGFSERSIADGTPLYVPCGSAASYSTSRWGHEFTNILEETEVSISVMTSNEEMGSVSGPSCESPYLIAAVPNNGYQFDHWQDGNTDNPRTVTVTDTASYIAYFSAIQYSVTATSDDTIMGQVTGGGAYAYGSRAVLIARAYSGYRFTHWQDGNTENIRQISVFSDTSFTAFFESIPSYTVNVEADNSSMGSVTGGGSYLMYTMATISATANTGYRFDHWQDGSTGNPLYLYVTNDTTIIAFFEPCEYTISVESYNSGRGSHGSTSGSGIYPYGTQVNISATADAGYQFDHWQDGNTENPRTVTVTDNATYTAYFERNYGIAAIEGSDVSVYSHNGRIVIAGTTDENVYIYDIMGRMLAKTAATDSETTIAVPSMGVYMVKIGNAPAQKVVVR